VRPGCTDREEATAAKVASLVVKFGALVFILCVPQKYAIDMQLLGGVWVLQTLPAVVVGLYTTRLHRWGVLAGWAAGMASGTWMVRAMQFKSVYPLHLGGLTVPGYAALWALAVNLAFAIAATFALDAAGAARGTDATVAADYV
jgi:SSS family solute:Na+ symporter